MRNPIVALRFSTFLMLLSLLITLAFSACSSKEGCTDCNATNFDPEADDDNGQCAYFSDRFVGIYIMQDSLVDPFQSVSEDPYEIEITQDCNNRNNLLISNLLSVPLGRVIRVIGDSLCFVESNGDCDPSSNGGFLINGDSLVIHTFWTSQPSGDAHQAFMKGRRK